MSDEIDYKALLVKYMRLIRCFEGTAYVEPLDESRWERNSFTPEEWAVLLELSRVSRE